MSQLNYYFGNREGLFTEVLDYMRIGYVEEVQRKMAKYESIDVKLDFLIAYNKKILIENSGLYNAFLDFFNLAMWSESFSKGMSAFIRDIADGISDSFANPTEMENCSQEKLANLVTMILGASFGIAMQYIMDVGNTQILESFDVLRDLVRSHLIGN